MRAAQSRKRPVDPVEKITTESPEKADRFNRVLGETIEALEQAGISYLFIGGIASGGLGRPRSTHDIDVFVRPEESELTLRALSRRGFSTEKTDPQWLYKAFKEDVLVDVIFKSKGEVYLDTEMAQRVTLTEYHGKRLRVVAPEDLIIIKALAHSEVTPGHWHDALAVLSHATIDWEYLVRRARKAPRRILSLLVYAHSNDIWVPKHVIDQLYVVVFGDMPPVGPHPANVSPVGPPRTRPSPASPLKVVSGARSPTDGHAVAELRERLAKDPRINELDIQITYEGGRYLLRGEVASDGRREAIEEIARETLPGVRVENQIRVARYDAPPAVEEVK